MSKLTQMQRWVLNKVASGEPLRWEQGKGLYVGDRRVRPVTLNALLGTGLVESSPYVLDETSIDYHITAAGFEALGIKLEATGPKATAGMVSMEALDQAIAALDKRVSPMLYIPGVGLIDMPPLSDEDEAALLRMVRERVPEFGHRPGYLEVGIVSSPDSAVLLLADASEPTYAAIFCEDEATALAIVTVYTGGAEPVQARHFPPEQLPTEGF